MTPDQYRYYNQTGLALPKEAQAQGFHYCAEWDEMLVGAPMTQEWSVCTCQAKQDYQDKKKDKQTVKHNHYTKVNLSG